MLTAEPVNVPSVSPLFDVVVVEEVAPDDELELDPAGVVVVDEVPADGDAGAGVTRVASVRFAFSGAATAASSGRDVR